MAAVGEWVLLSYRLPREPSAPRVTVWRKLRRLGAVQLVDGVVPRPRRREVQDLLVRLDDEGGEAGADGWACSEVAGPKEVQGEVGAPRPEAGPAAYRDLHDEAEAVL